MYLLGYDVGSSSVKASLINAENGRAVASAFYPKKEMKIAAPKAGWAEQDPEQWWTNLILATNDVLQSAEIDPSSITAIGIAYRMHGLVLVDKDHQLLRSSIIWCDSRAVSHGDHAMQSLGEEQCLSHLLNSPGNFTASKLADAQAADATLSPCAASVGLSLPSKTGPGLDVGGTVPALPPCPTEPTAITFFASAGVTTELGGSQ